MSELYKDFRIVPQGSFPLLKIMAKAQGQIPTALSGMYTNTSEAKKDIDLFMSHKPVKKSKVVKDGESKNTG